jgi:hypothetical protein
MNQVLYLYCLAHGDRLAAPEGTGVDGNGPVSLHRFQDLAAVLSMVSLEEFSGETAEQNLSDVTWVGPRACRHAEVVAETAKCSPVLPVRFGTIFSAPQALERFLESHHCAIREFLDRVVDQEEWSVKGILDRSRARGAILSTCLSDENDRLAALPPGRRYMEEQRLQGRVEGELNGWLRGACRAVSADLGSLATDCCQRRVLPHGGAATEMVLNLAFLVPPAATAEFLGRIERANAEHSPQGLSFQLSGPWPPYSFSPVLDDAGAPGPEPPPR